jgi:hypothetical protein
MMPARKHLLNLCILLKSNAGVVIDGIKTVSDIDAVVLGGKCDASYAFIQGSNHAEVFFILTAEISNLSLNKE